MKCTKHTKYSNWLLKGCDMYFAFNKYIGYYIKNPIDDNAEDSDDVSIYQVKAAEIVRRHMLDLAYRVEGAFE